MGKRRSSGDGMVRKREDGRWEGRIVIGHKDNGEPIFRYPDGVSPKKKAIAAYLRENPGVTSKSRIARELNMDRSTVQKYYDEIRSEIREGNVQAS